MLFNHFLQSQSSNRNDHYRNRHPNQGWAIQGGSLDPDPPFSNLWIPGSVDPWIAHPCLQEDKTIS